jgi:malic enzyme
MLDSKGTSGTPGSFTGKAIREMAARTPTPSVFPRSNPTAKSEATPADVLGDLRQVSRSIAIAVAREARSGGVARMDDRTEVENAVDAAMWTPGYEELKL